MFRTAEDRMKKIKAVAKLIVETVEAVEDKKVQLFEVTRFIDAQAIKLMQLTK